MTPTELTDRALLELACGADEALKSGMDAAAFRRALLLAGHGHTDTSEIPEDVWNRAIDRSTCLGHEPDANEPAGISVYCDGRCRR